ncbi:MAG: DUF4912 domain-containing protein [Candidatus Omnitrophica bacterium]|nr:DUF4912 domain-containing protein [Candidatus Omnitrophota bacterium]
MKSPKKTSTEKEVKAKVPRKNVVKKAVKKTTKKAVKKAVKKSVKKTAKKAVKKTVKKTAEKVVKKSAKTTAKKTVKKAAPKKTPAASASKTRQKTKTFVFQENVELPSDYSTTYVTLLPRDPYCLYAYWEIDSHAVEDMKQKTKERFNDGVYTLRLYDVTCIEFNGQNANWWRDYDELFMPGRYLNGVNDNATYCVEIGVRNSQGEFFAFSRSNFCETPRANFSQRHDLIWREELNDIDARMFVNAKLFNRKERKAFAPRTNWQLGNTRVTLSKDDLQKYYTSRKSLNKQLKSLASLLHGKTKGIKIVDGDVYVEDALIPGFTNKNVFEYKPIGSSDTQVRTIQQDMAFEVEMELTVKGKTDPDAVVYLAGQPVQLNGDGTFTLKYKLGDDFLPFNFSALSKEKGLIKKIRTSVLRSKTEYEQSS